MSDGTVRRYIIKKAMIAVAPIEEKVEVVLASDYDALHAQAREMAEFIDATGNYFPDCDFPDCDEVPAIRLVAQAVLKEGGDE